jgi:hypothetical protein
MSRTLSSRLREAVLIIVGVPVVGILMGGVYSLAASRITRGREPWLTLLLAVGLSITVVAVGIVAGASWRHLAVVLLFALLGLVATRSLFGPFGGDLIERFGSVHFATLVLLSGVLSFPQRQYRPRDGGASTWHAEGSISPSPVNRSRRCSPRRVTVS